MKPNDDIVGQAINNIVETGEGEIEIRLSNAMIITSSGAFKIYEGGMDCQIQRWITVRNGKRIRDSQPQLLKRIAELKLLTRAYQLIADQPRISEYEGDGGVHPNDFRAVVKDWVRDYKLLSTGKEA